ncbi:MAG: DUF6527 family protein [Myxococcota bacterium]
MSWLGRLWVTLCGWFGRNVPKLAPAPSPPPFARGAQLYTVAHAEEEPEDLAPMTVYAIGEGSHLWHVAMLCPCGCGAKIQLNALPDDEPCWTLVATDGVPTLSPSVWRKVGCRSHFFLRSGRIRWC